jgi:hypothetical protein
MKKGINIFFVLFSVWVLFYSCRKIQSFPVIPSIEFQRFTIRDTFGTSLGSQRKVGELVFSFVDGDGDIGFQSTTTETDTIYDLFLTMYEKLSGEFFEVENLEPPLNYHLPYIEREGQNKTLKGEIQVKIDYFELYKVLLNSDTIKFDFFIIDRAFHKSNVETTPEIVFKL